MGHENEKTLVPHSQVGLVSDQEGSAPMASEEKEGRAQLLMCVLHLLQLEQGCQSSCQPPPQLLMGLLKVGHVRGPEGC